MASRPAEEIGKGGLSQQHCPPGGGEKRRVGRGKPRQHRNPADVLGKHGQEAAQKMQRLGIGLLSVCDGDRLIGMLTDHDITVRAVAEGCDPKTTTVREAMTPDIAYCFAEQEVQEAAHLLEQD